MPQHLKCLATVIYDLPLITRLPVNSSHTCLITPSTRHKRARNKATSSVNPSGPVITARRWRTCVYIRRGKKRDVAHTGWPKKLAPFLYALTSSNINRFSNLFHCQNQEKICNNTITKDPTTPQVFRYTTMRNAKPATQLTNGAISETLGQFSQLSVRPRDTGKP